jgi:hypothetical protein
MKNVKNNNFKVFFIFISEGDEILDEIRGTAKIIKNQAINIRDEMHLHDPLLHNLERNVIKYNILD